MSEGDVHSAAFPRLDGAEIERLERCTGGERRRYRDGEVLVELGQREFDFHVVLSGGIEVLDVTADEPKSVAVHGPGEFTGDVAHVTGRPSIARLVAHGDTEVLQIPRSTLKQVLAQCPDTGDTILQTFIARRQLVRRPGAFTGLRVIGSRHATDTFRIREFLARNRVPFTWVDLESDPEVEQLLRRFGVSEADTPIVSLGPKIVLRNPSNAKLAEAIGMKKTIERRVHDLVIVGGGPAGLAAAVYGASEGLDTVVLERTAPGGQAGNSMRIENYLGFPTGITGGDLADRALLQANKFGAVITLPCAVVGLGPDGSCSAVTVEGGETVVARAVIVANGIDYRRLPVPDCSRFEGCGVYYAATHVELQGSVGRDVVVVGGGNSAGQAAVFLASEARRVFLIVRDGSLEKSMSAYLARRIEQTPSITVRLRTEVTGLSGEGELARVHCVDRSTGERSTLDVPALFSFIGAVPRTEWLRDALDVDAYGFVLTGPAVSGSAAWKAARDPHYLETSRRGVFAAGDVRSGSVKRCATAVGEGAMAVRFVHDVLAEG